MSKQDNKKTVKTPQEVIAEFRESLKDKTLEQLEEIEKLLLEEQEQDAQKQKDAEFTLPKKNYKEAAIAIRAAMDTIKVGWQMTLGLVKMYEFFDPDNMPEKVPYLVLDNMLRTLSSAAQFEGYNQWKHVLTINEYFEPIREEYAELANLTFINAEKYGALMQAQEMFKPQSPQKPMAN